MSGILQTLFLGAAAAVKDAYFNLVTLLLNTTATNGAQNNTFLDSSTNNFSITRNGNTTQGTFTPFSQTGWSMYLPGSNSSYIQTPSSSVSTILGGSVTSLGSLTFTIECFLNVPTGAFIIGDCNPGNDTANLILGVNNDGTISLGGTFGGYTTRNSTGTINFNKWNHCAWVVTGGNVYFYINGAAAGSGSVGNTSGQYGQFIFGGYNNNFSSKQYLSNFRITKSAVYSGAYTVPTTPFSAIAGTTLLTFQSNRFRDNSANNYALTINGIPSIEAFSPFAPAYITPTTYSNWFNGSTGYLLGGTNAAYTLGTGDFSIEFWMNGSTTGSVVSPIGFGGSSVSNVPNVFLNVTATANVRLNSTNGSALTTGANVWSANTWAHVVVTRQTGVARIFVNGVLQAQGAFTDNLVGTDLCIGRSYYNASQEYFYGALSNLRVVKGSVPTTYQTSSTSIGATIFTPPTTPLTTTSQGTTAANVSILTCQNSTFIDNSTNAFTITAYGNAQPVASPTPFAPTVETEAAAYSTTLVGGSGYFDGTGDYLAGTGNTTNSNVALTVEAWVYFTGSTASRSIFSNMSVSGGTSGIALATTPSGYITFARGNGGAGTNVTSSTPTYVNTWYHFAAVRTSGGAITLFQNGAIVATGSDGSSTDRTSFVIGAAYTDLAVNNPQGYIASLRVTTGAALYASAFAPSFAPFTTTVSSGTVTLLTNFTNAGIYDSTAKNDLETVGNAQVSTTQAKWGSTSMYFDGSGDWLYNAASSLNVGFGTGNFTVEMWVYPTTNPANGPGTVMDARNSATSEGWVIRIFADLSVGFYDGPANVYQQTAASAVPLNTWTYLAFVRSGTTLTIYVNGTSAKTATVSSNLGTSWPFYIGNNYTAGYTYYGYIDDLRITKGYARTISASPSSAFPIQ